MKRFAKKGATSIPVYVFIQDTSKTDGSGLTGLVYNSAGITAAYVRQLSAAVTVPLVTQTVTGAFSAGGFVEVDPVKMKGVYRFDVPDAALVTGSNSATFSIDGAALMAPVKFEIELLDVDLRNATNMGMSALPAVAFGTEGGLGSLLVRTGTLQAGATPGTAILDAGASAVDGQYVGQLLRTTGGTGAKQVRAVSGYTGSSKTVAVAPDWAVTPDATTTFELIAVPGLVAPTDYARYADILTVIGEIDSQATTTASAVGSTSIGDGSLTIVQALQIAVAVLAGKASGLDTANPTFRDAADTLNRVVATISAGNRTTVINAS